MDLPSTPSFARVRASSASRTFTMLETMWWPIRSKRKPSTLYYLAQVTSESTMSFSNMACSLAVLAQQVLVSTWPLSFKRW